MASIKEIQSNISEIENTGVKNIRSGKKRKNKLVIFLFTLSIILGILYYKQSAELSRLKDPALQTEYAQKQIEKVIDEMKKYVVIPEDEQLKLFGIIDNAEKLKKDQPFYSNVENGDYVFLFSKTARALIWRPQEKKVINFGVADIQQANVQQDQSTVKEQESKDVKNGDKKTDN